MKRIISGVIFSMLVLPALSQTNDCNKVKNGTFKSIMGIGEEKEASVIYRKGNKQIEENIANGIKMSFTVKWTSDCTYELSKPKMLKGVLEGVADSQIIYVKIIEVTSEKYTAEVSSNFFDAVAVFSYSIVR